VVGSSRLNRPVRSIFRMQIGHQRRDTVELTQVSGARPGTAPSVN
jgi:hypothetical protein